MWEIAAIVDMLERKSHCTKQDLYDINSEFRRTNPRFDLGREVYKLRHRT
jgi:hypothetical protein